MSTWPGGLIHLVLYILPPPETNISPENLWEDDISFKYGPFSGDMLIFFLGGSYFIFSSGIVQQWNDDFRSCQAQSDGLPTSFKELLGGISEIPYFCVVCHLCGPCRAR